MFRSSLRKFGYKLPGTFTSVEAETKGTAPPSGYIRPIETYKPSKTIQFDKKGEILIYEFDSQCNNPIFFPFPWSIGTWSTPALGWAWWHGFFGSAWWLAPIAVSLATLPHCWYLYELRFNVNRIWYVRGGLWKIENIGPYRLGTNTYTELSNIKLFSQTSNKAIPYLGSSSGDGADPHGGKFADILNEEGKLTHNLVLQAEFWQEYYEVEENRKIAVDARGKVHNPEIFQALAQGYKIDDSNCTMTYDPENEFSKSQ